VEATRAAYKALGQNPARYRGSAEALLRRVVGGKGVPEMLCVVDAIHLVFGGRAAAGWDCMIWDTLWEKSFFAWENPENVQGASASTILNLKIAALPPIPSGRTVARPAILSAHGDAPRKNSCR